MEVRERLLEHWEEGITRVHREPRGFIGVEYLKGGEKIGKWAYGVTDN